MHETKGLAEAECPVRANAVLVLKLGVTGQFRKTHLLCPRFSPSHERPANSFAPQIQIHIPTFDVSDPRGHGAINPVANGQLDKAAKLAMPAFVNEDRELATADFLGHFEIVHLGRAIGPERSAHTPPFGEISASNCAGHVSRMAEQRARSNGPMEEARLRWTSPLSDSALVTY